MKFNVFEFCILNHVESFQGAFFLQQAMFSKSKAKLAEQYLKLQKHVMERYDSRTQMLREHIIACVDGGSSYNVSRNYTCRRIGAYMEDG